MNIYNGSITISQVTPVDGTIDQWNLICLFNDNTGSYFASDTMVGDVIYIDGTPYNLGILRYKVTFVDLDQTDFNNLYVTVQWDEYSDVNDSSSPQTGFDSCIGRVYLGAVYLPSATVQNLPQSFLDYVRNYESSRATQVSFINRTFNGPYIGDIDGFNQVFQVVDPFIVETLEVFINGVRQNLGVGEDPNDYLLIGNNQIQLTVTPYLKDLLTFNYNKK